MNNKTCPYCRRPMMVHQHRFSKALAIILLIATRRYGPGDPFHLQKDFPDFTKNQYANFQKLRYWGLVEKHYDFLGKRAGGYWRLTSATLDLIGSCDRIPAWVRTFNNEVIERSSETVAFKGAIGYYDIPEKWVAKAKPIETFTKGQLAFSY